jgi:alpha-N-arabinofuranosidase
VFAVNRSSEHAVDITIDLQHAGPLSLVEALVLTDPDPYAANSPTDPERVVVRPSDSARLRDGHLDITLPPVCWTMVRLHGRGSARCEAS